MSITTVNSTVDNDGFWQRQQAQNNVTGLTSIEINRLALRILSLCAAGGGLVLIGAAALGALTLSAGLIAIPCALIASGSLWYSFKLNDYESPEDLVKIRDLAAKMTFDQVMQKHGWNAVLGWGIISAEQFTAKYRAKMQNETLVNIIKDYEKTVNRVSQCRYQKFCYHVPPPSESQRKWRPETSTKTFEQIIQTYAIDKLQKYSLVGRGELERIQRLKRDYEEIKMNYDTQSARFERDFDAATASFKANYLAACAQADQIYNNDEAVRHLQVFDTEYPQARQGVQEATSARKIQARAQFDRAVAPFTNKGKIAYNKLAPAHKTLYNRHLKEMQISFMQAEADATGQIAQIDARSTQERMQLNAQQQSADAIRQRARIAAKGLFDDATAVDRSNKERLLAPFHKIFRTAVNDLDGRYRAFLRATGAGS